MTPPTLQQTPIRLGTSGWSYADWVGSFYPAGTPATQWLALYAQAFSTVELDTTFYRPPTERMLAAWQARTPEHFQFAAKVPRTITHAARLVGVAEELLAFAAQMRRLGSRCGPLLLQLPPSFTATAAHRDALATLLPILPRDLRWAVEVRHRSWLHAAFYDLLRAHNVALVHVDRPGMPRTTPVTADFVYIRWLGDRHQISADFSHVRPEWQRTADLDWWTRQIRRLAEHGIAVYGYANNHYQGHSPATVRALQQRLGLPHHDALPPHQQRLEW